jgi:nucleoside-diphosphate-sugar epimerase
MKRALVTGATGFLGRHLVRLLAEHGYSVRGLVRRRDEALAASGVELVHGDLRGIEAVREACREIDVVFHAASVSGIWGSWKHFHGNNVIATRNVIQAAQENGVKRLVYTSSPSVTFTGEHQINVDETAPYATRFLASYPRSKAMAEQQVLQANDGERLMTCALRPHLIWGPGDRHLIPRLLDRARAGQLRRVGDGTNQVDNIHVVNAAVAHIQAAESMSTGSPVCGRAYFLSQNDPVNCWGWINELLQLAGLPRVRQSISYFWAYRLGYALECYHEMFDIDREPRMTRFLAAQLAKSHYFDISRAQRDFGYRPIVSLDKGMKQLAETLGQQ